jgi:hypothetical protein
MEQYESRQSIARSLALVALMWFGTVAINVCGVLLEATEYMNFRASSVH